MQRYEQIANRDRLAILGTCLRQAPGFLTLGDDNILVVWFVKVSQFRSFGFPFQGGMSK